MKKKIFIVLIFIFIISLLPVTLWLKNLEIIDNKGNLNTPIITPTITPSSENPDQYNIELENAARNIKEKTGLTVHYNDRVDGIWPNIRYTFSDSYEMLSYGLEVVGYELSKYPEGFLDSVGIEDICLYSSVISGRVPASGVSNGTGVILDVATFADSTIHHEIFHCIEYSEFNKFDTNWEEWLKYNTDGFNYSPSAYELYKLGELLPTGILTPYSMYAPYEDRAEIFSYIMTDGLRNELFRRTSYDRLLRSKALLILQNVNRFTGEPDKNYWNQMSLSQIVSPDRQTPDIIAVSKNTECSIYSLPSQTSKALKELDKGRQVLVLESGQGWHRVAYGDITGFIPDENLDFIIDKANTEITEIKELLKSNNGINIVSDVPHFLNITADMLSDNEMFDFINRLDSVLDNERLNGKIVVPVKNLKEFTHSTKSFNTGFIIIIDHNVTDQELFAAINE